MSNFHAKFLNLVTAVAVALIFVAPVKTASASEGGGPENVTSIEINDKGEYERSMKKRSMKKKSKKKSGTPKKSSLTRTANTVKAIGTPARTRAKVIATVGAVAGTIVGEVATSTVTCIARCFGSKTKYRPGDMTKRLVKGLKKMWGD